MLLEDFLHSATHHADNCAVVCAGKHSSYHELKQQVGRIANWLQSRISPGDRIALLLENSADYIACYYGIWAAGGVAVGLNTALTDADIGSLLLHCGARIVAVDGAAGKRRQALGELDIAMLLAGEPAPCEPHETPLRDLPLPAGDPGFYRATSDELAAIIYTSGTTGDPKGVMLSHGNLTCNTGSIRKYLSIEPTDRVMCVLPFYYSYGNSVLHSHISSGACLVLENSLMYPRRVLEQLERQQVTGFYGVPSTYYLLLARTRAGDVSLASLRYCAQAGGPMHDAKIEQWLERAPHTDFVVMYGQTEASARLTWLASDQRRKKPGSVGKPIDGVELSIKDERGYALEAGSTGEVCARGDNVMQGYWRDGQATAQVLRDGWLHTGDLGYLDGEGYLFLVGRSREQIKTGAHRVSPLEIEKVIAAVEGVRDVAVIGIDDAMLGQVIKACVIVDGHDNTLQKTILRSCRQHLASYKIPREVGFYDDFPRTASGKIQKHLLQ